MITIINCNFLCVPDPNVDIENIGSISGDKFEILINKNQLVFLPNIKEVISQLMSILTSSLLKNLTFNNTLIHDPGNGNLITLTIADKMSISLNGLEWHENDPLQIIWNLNGDLKIS